MISPQPGAALYAQVAARLRDDILAGRLRPGQRLPSETDLQQQYGVARQTARRAVNVLRAEGLATYERGHGVVVREHPEVQNLIPPAGSVVTVRTATIEEKAELELDDGIPVFSVAAPDGTVELFPGDRWQLRWPT